MQDLLYAVRTQRRNPLFALTVIATLAVDIGANTAIFSFVDTILLRPLPYGDPERLVMQWQDFSATGGSEQEWFTPPDFQSQPNRPCNRRQHRSSTRVGCAAGDVVARAPGSTR